VDHDDAGIELEELRVLTHAYLPPAGASATHEALYACLAALDRDIRVHLHIEQELLFPRALALEAVARTR
jgi:regulator of cell morphogenesis and NO signaling